MADIFTKEKRSEVMSRIRSKWTGPEVEMHNFLKGSNIRHRMHPKIPGSPDVLLTDGNVAVFVHGCFWHGCKKHFKMPKTNTGFWRNKIEGNVRRDSRALRAARKSGYGCMIIWEHDFKNDKYKGRIRPFFRRKRFNDH